MWCYIKNCYGYQDKFKRQVEVSTLHHLILYRSGEQYLSLTEALAQQCVKKFTTFNFFYTTLLIHFGNLLSGQLHIVDDSATMQSLQSNPL